MGEDRDVSNFEKLATKTKERLMAGKDKSKEWLHLAIDASAEQREKAGEFTKEEGKRASSFLKRDLAGRGAREGRDSDDPRVGKASSPNGWLIPNRWQLAGLMGWSRSR